MTRNISVIEQLNNLHAATYTGKRHIADSMTDSAAKCHQAMNLEVLSDTSPDDKIPSLLVTSCQLQLYHM